MADLTSGVTVGGNVATKGAVASFTVSAVAGGSIAVSVTETAAGPLRPQLTLYSPSNEILFRDWSGVGLNGDAANLKAGGTYRITVDDFGGTETGAFALTAVSVGPGIAQPAAEDGGTLTSGVTRTAAIGVGDSDVFQIAGKAGGTLLTSFAETTANAPQQTQVLVYDPSGGLMIIPLNAWTSTGMNETFENLPATGTYTLVVRDWTSRFTGGYALTAVSIGAGIAQVAAEDGGALTNRQTRSAAIGIGDSDVFQINAIAGGSLLASFAETTADSPLRPQVLVYDPNGVPLLNPLNAWDNVGLDETLTGLRITGTYTLVVRDYDGANTGGYRLQVVVPFDVIDVLPDADNDGGPMLSGLKYEAAIDRAANLDVFTLDASGNDSFTLTATPAANGAVRPQVLVFDPKGVLVGSVSESAGVPAAISYATPSVGAGRYTVVVRHAGGSGSNGRTGGYALQLLGNLLLPLARLSQDVYRDTRIGYAAAGFSTLASDSDPSSPGYAAQAYFDAGRTQIAVAFRGTVPAANAAGLATVAADTSFLTGVPSPVLTSIVADAALFVATLRNLFPGRPIVLTGHSLGGAVAQLLANASLLTTQTFNAPGAVVLYGKLYTYLSPVRGIGNSGANTNYRLYGDQVSLAGGPLGTQITLAAPAGTTFADYADPLLHVVGNLKTFLNLHSLDRMIEQIENNAPRVSQTGEPNDAAVVESAFTPKSILTAHTLDQFVFNFAFLVTAGVRTGALLTYSGGRDAVLSADAASPAVSSVTLPVADGVTAYRVRYQTAGGWSAYQSVAPGVVYTPAQASRTLQFLPTNVAGESVSVPDGQFLRVTFAATGTFNGTLSTGGAAVPAWLSLGDKTDAKLDGNTLTLTYGTATFLADAGLANPNLNVVVRGSARVVFSAAQHLGALTLNDAAAANFTAGRGRALRVTGLSVVPAATLDLNDGDFVLDYSGPSPADAVRGLITTARGSGGWTGTGLTSASARTNTARSTTLGYLEAATFKAIYGPTTAFDGEPVDDSAVIVRYTLYGDTDLDGGVSINDFNALAGNFGQASGRVWAQGDLDYDNGVSINDFNALAGNFGTTLAAVPPPAVPQLLSSARARTANLSGVAFNDANRNSTYDRGDSLAAGKTIWLDLDNDGRRDANEPSTVTGKDGRYRFRSLAAGTYHVRQVVDKGYTVSTSQLNVSLTSGQIKTGLLIGTKKV